jgi:hypothetical protein
MIYTMLMNACAETVLGWSLPLNCNLFVDGSFRTET